MKKQTSTPTSVQELPWTITIHRFQPKKGRHQNQTFTLCGNSDEPLPPAMVLAFGDVQQTAVYDLVARTHAVVQIQIDSTHNAIHIFTAPTEIRPYTEKVVDLDAKMRRNERALDAQAPINSRFNPQINDIARELENQTAIDGHKISIPNNHPMSCNCPECEVL